MTCKAWQAEVNEVVGAVTTHALRSVVRWCGERVLQSAEERRAAGELEFHDLLVLARDVLRDNAEVRASLQTGTSRLLLDEFQDTDPIQIEIAVRIAGGAAADAERWEDVDVPPGSIFVVGDPKQSIYRFRRADIGMYLRAREVLGGHVTLTTNFRTGAPILDWVNEVFERLIVEDPGKQPAYIGARRPPRRPDERPAGGGARRGRARRPAGRGGCASARPPTSRAPSSPRSQEGWTTEAVVGHDADGEAVREWRPLRPGDITILVPARTSLPFLEEALDAAGVAYRTESSSLVYSAPEVRDLFAAARAVADPSDALRARHRAALAAVRLRRRRPVDVEAGRRLVLLLRAAATRMPSRTRWVPASGYLQRLHYDSRWMTPSEVLGRDRHRPPDVRGGCRSRPRTRDAWRRLRFVIDQARAWSESEHGGLRAYLAWAAAQSAEGSRVAESVLPGDRRRLGADHDDPRRQGPGVPDGRALRHVVGPEPRARRPAAVDGRRLRRQGRQRHRDRGLRRAPAARRADERPRADAAAVRRRHPGPRPPRRVAAPREDPAERRRRGRTRCTSPALVRRPQRMPCSWRGTPTSRSRPRQRPSVTPPPDLEQWLERMRASAAASRRVPAVSASGLEGTDPDALEDGRRGDRPLTQTAPRVQRGGRAAGRGGRPAGLAKGARDVEQPAWAKGRYGSAIGRAVHGVLQSIDLRTGAGLDDAVAAQCLAEGVVEFTDLVDGAGPLGPRPTRSSSAPPSASTGASPTSGRSRRTAPSSRASSTSSTARTTARSSSSTTRPTTSPTPRSRRERAYYQPQLDAYRRMLSDAVESTVANPTLVFLHPKGI